LKNPIENDTEPVCKKLENAEPGAFYLKSYSETATPFGRSRNWTSAEATKLRLSRTSADDQDWEQRLLTESWPAIILGQTATFTFLLVVGRIHPEDDFYERIGVIQMAPEAYSLDFQNTREEFRLG
jgi:hypothetical protein